MSLSRSLRTALAAERRTLVQQKRRTDERLAAIDLLLSEEETPSEKRSYTRRSSSKRTAREAKETRELDLPLKAIGFRDVLKGTLNGRGYTKPGEVIQVLRDRGYSVGGKTPLATRVYNELKRMRREEILDRDTSGRYALKAG